MAKMILQHRSGQARKIIVGVDFDGVVAYNPFRLVRAPWAFFKNRILGIKRLTFFYPKTKFSRYIWKIMHDSSVYPAKGKDLLVDLVRNGVIEAHLISGRYGFLNDHLYAWLDKYSLRDIFKSINFNREDKQPHLFKEELIKRLNLDIFVEDNWDIVKYLKTKFEALQPKSETKIFWIFNILDRFKKYKYKYPYLEKALQNIK